MKRRGFTLLELLLVVAIVAVLAGLSANAISQTVTLGRVNGAANDTARVLMNGRLRAATMACRTSVQINGPTYAPPSTAVGPRQASTVFVFMKANCIADQTHGFFEVGGTYGNDRLIASFPLEKVSTNVTAGILGGSTTLMGNNSVLVTWGMVNGALQRDMFVDDTGGGAFAPVAFVSPVTFTFGNASTNQSRLVTIPVAGPPTLN
jgi:prepilin-type N-terminal cleavage/methylation domain-containing protein